MRTWKALLPLTFEVLACVPGVPQMPPRATGQPSPTFANDIGPGPISVSDLTGVWAGAYNCLGRDIHLELMIEAREADWNRCKDRPCQPPETIPKFAEVRCLMSLVPDAGPDAAISVSMFGTFVNRSGTLRSSSARSPSEYEPLGFLGTFSSDGKVFAGTVRGQGCTGFSVAKAAP